MSRVDNIITNYICNLSPLPALFMPVSHISLYYYYFITDASYLNKHHYLTKLINIKCYTHDFTIFLKNNVLA